MLFFSERLHWYLVERCEPFFYLGWHMWVIVLNFRGIFNDVPYHHDGFQYYSLDC